MLTVFARINQVDFFLIVVQKNKKMVTPMLIKGYLLPIYLKNGCE